MMLKSNTKHLRDPWHGRQTLVLCLSSPVALFARFCCSMATLAASSTDRISEVSSSSSYSCGEISFRETGWWLVWLYSSERLLCWTSSCGCGCVMTGLAVFCFMLPEITRSMVTSKKTKNYTQSYIVEIVLDLLKPMVG